jgi:hypothetical protein
MYNLPPWVLTTTAKGAVSKPVRENESPGVTNGDDVPLVAFYDGGYILPSRIQTGQD